MLRKLFNPDRKAPAVKAVQPASRPARKDLGPRQLEWLRRLESFAECEARVKAPLGRHWKDIRQDSAE